MERRVRYNHPRHPWRRTCIVSLNSVDLILEGALFQLYGITTINATVKMEHADVLVDGDMVVNGDFYVDLQSTLFGILLN